MWVEWCCRLRTWLHYCNEKPSFLPYCLWNTNLLQYNHIELSMQYVEYYNTVELKLVTNIIFTTFQEWNSTHSFFLHSPYWDTIAWMIHWAIWRTGNMPYHEPDKSNIWRHPCEAEIAKIWRLTLVQQGFYTATYIKTAKTMVVIKNVIIGGMPDSEHVNTPNVKP